jgi:hypothetical protein
MNRPWLTIRDCPVRAFDDGGLVTLAFPLANGQSRAGLRRGRQLNLGSLLAIAGDRSSRSAAAAKLPDSTTCRNTLMPVSVSTPILFYAAARYDPSGVLSDEAAFGLSVGEETSPLAWSTKKISSARQTGIPMSRANATRKRTRIGASR